MHYNNLIDASVVKNVNFHPKVIDYVDYSTPAITKYSSARTYNYSSGGTSKYSGKYFSQNDEYSYAKWLERNTKKYMESQDLNDPYYFSEHYYGGEHYVDEDISKHVRLWEIEDLIRDYVRQNQGDFNKLFILVDTLNQEAKSLESDIFSEYSDWNEKSSSDELEAEFSEVSP